MTPRRPAKPRSLAARMTTELKRAGHAAAALMRERASKQSSRCWDKSSKLQISSVIPAWRPESEFRLRICTVHESQKAIAGYRLSPSPIAKATKQTGALRRPPVELQLIPSWRRTSCSHNRFLCERARKVPAKSYSKEVGDLNNLPGKHVDALMNMASPCSGFMKEWRGLWLHDHFGNYLA